jgi:hypothetical protein
VPWTFFGRTFGNNTNAAPDPPATPTLAVADLQNGGGATATVTGADAGASVVVYVAPVDQGGQPPAWTAAGSRTGSGTVSLSGLTPKLYYGYAKSTLSGSTAASAPVEFTVSRAGRAVIDYALDAILGRLQTLTFAAVGSYPATIPSSRIVRRDSFNETVLATLPEKPCICCSLGKSFSFIGGTNARDDLAESVVAVLLDYGSPANPVPQPAWEKWGEQISRAVRHQRLTGIETLVHDIVPQDYEPISWSGPEGAKGYDLGFVAVPWKIITRDPRGV